MGSPYEVPERCFAGGGGDANPRRATIHVVGYIRRFRMACQGPNAAYLRLRKGRMICETMVLQQTPQGPGTTAKTQRIDRQDGILRVHVVAWITRARLLAGHGLAHDHPQR